MSKERVNIIVEGRVQGVFYRARTIEKARELQLNGWVKNRIDGTVEIVAEGNKQDLERLVDWSQHGPKHAHVTKVEVKWEPFVDEFTDFTVKY
ncbi:MAG: acylphosphatase [Thermodesulfobacteriota bacterium]